VSKFDIDVWISGSGLDIIKGPEPWQGGRRWTLRRCPFNDEHLKPVILEMPGGALAYKCLHKSCEQNDWKALRTHVDPPPAKPSHTHRQRSEPPSAEPTPQLRQADWHWYLITNDKGAYKPILANATTALREAPELKGLLRFDSFAARLTVHRTPPWGSPKPGAQWTDQEDRKLTEWLQREGICVGVDIAGLAAQTVAMENSYNPVQDYLSGLEWDGTKRIDTWVSLYLGVEHSDYVSAVGSRFLIAGVSRALSDVPVKSDCVLVLEGKQGTYKSTAAARLFSPWFTDHLPDLSTKDAYLQLAGMWGVELAEMDTLSKATITKVKSFLSSQVDRYRMPYGKRAIDVPRHNVFVGTTNKDQWLPDETGGRRFWPIQCGRIELEALSRDRDQLWAEAVVRYQAGGKWWLDKPELVKEAEQEQVKRYEGGVWDEMIARWIEDPGERTDQHGNPVAPFNSDKNSVTVPDILNHCIGKRADQWTQMDKNTVARCLRVLGWERFLKRTGSVREWRYRREGNG
jgi:predicted P-loop ATPase